MEAEDLKKITNPMKRYLAVYLIETLNSNPNGSIPSGAPRVDYLGRGEISAVAVKRKIRDWAKNYGGMALYHDHRADLKGLESKYGKGPEAAAKITKDFVDIRLFGSTLPHINSGKRGAVQLSPMLTIDPVEIKSFGFTSVAGTMKDVEKAKPKKNAPAPTNEDDGEVEQKLSTAFNFRETVEFGLYQGTLTYNPLDGKGNEVSEKDLSAFWLGMVEGWETSQSAQRTNVNVRRVYIFESDAQRGKEPVHVTHGRVEIGLNPSAASFKDYEVTVRTDDLPSGMRAYAWEDGKFRTLRDAK